MIPETTTSCFRTRIDNSPCCRFSSTQSIFPNAGQTFFFSLSRRLIRFREGLDELAFGGEVGAEEEFGVRDRCRIGSTRQKETWMKLPTHIRMIGSAAVTTVSDLALKTKGHSPPRPPCTFPLNQERFHPPSSFRLIHTNSTCAHSANARFSRPFVHHLKWGIPQLDLCSVHFAI